MRGSYNIRDQLQIKIALSSLEERQSHTQETVIKEAYYQNKQTYSFRMKTNFFWRRINDVKNKADFFLYAILEN